MKKEGDVCSNCGSILTKQLEIITLDMDNISIDFPDRYLMLVNVPSFYCERCREITFQNNEDMFKKIRLAAEFKANIIFGDGRMEEIF
jgi:hypothetical protein